MHFLIFISTKANRQTIFFSLCESVEPETIILKPKTVQFIHICSLYLLKLNYFHLSISIRKDLMLRKCEKKKNKKQPSQSAVVCKQILHRRQTFQKVCVLSLNVQVIHAARIGFVESLTIALVFHFPIVTAFGNSHIYVQSPLCLFFIQLGLLKSASIEHLI